MKNSKTLNNNDIKQERIDPNKRNKRGEKHTDFTPKPQLSHRNMPATLMYFILDVTAILLPHVPQNLGKHIFKCIVAHLTAVLSWCLDRFVTIITYIERGAIEVATVLRGIAVLAAKLCHIGLRAQHTRHNDLMKGDAFNLKTVKKIASYILQQHRSTRHEVRYAVAKAVDIEVRVAANIHQFLDALGGFGAVCHRFYAPFAGSSELDIVLIGTRNFISGHAINAVTGLAAIGIEETRRAGGIVCSHKLVGAAVGHPTR